MKIALLNDSHFGVRNSSDLLLKYQKKFFSEVFFPYCEKHNIKEMIHLGDYFDNRKSLNVKAIHESRKMFLEPFQDLEMRGTMICGNHDVLYKNTNNVCSLKELLGYYINNIDIITHPTDLKYDGYTIGLLPWINSENYEESMNFIRSSKAKIICAHLELLNFDMMKGVASSHGLDSSLFERFKMVLTGHFHTKSSKKNIHYLGSQYELTWADHNDPKYFHVFDTDTEELAKVRNPHTIFEKIYFNDEVNNYSIDSFDVQKYYEKYVKLYIISRKNTSISQLDNLVQRIQDIGAYDVKLIDSFEDFNSDDISNENIDVADTKELINNYIDSINTDLDKNKIKKIVQELLVEAQNEETL